MDFNNIFYQFDFLAMVAAEKYPAQIQSIYACTWFFIPANPGNECILFTVEKDTWRIFSKKLADLVPEIPKNLNSAKEKLGVLFWKNLT